MPPGIIMDANAAAVKKKSRRRDCPCSRDAASGKPGGRRNGPTASVLGDRLFVHGVGVLLRPDTEVRWTNRLDIWAVSRTNRLGFPDREPPSPKRAPAGCHIAIIGDSFVEALQVTIPEKFQVRLEEMAARELPALGVTNLSQNCLNNISSEAS